MLILADLLVVTEALPHIARKLIGELSYYDLPVMFYCVKRRNAGPSPRSQASQTFHALLLGFPYPRDPVVPNLRRHDWTLLAPTPVPPYLRRYDWIPGASLLVV